ncbi:hypothetical protein DFH09DRAFT_1376649 [Mycena vulgaris]|nr:hypothetical protein DFH09DRAFT_1376649 [Mycena vulgaris]
MAKGKFSSAQNAHLSTYIPEYVSKLDAGVQGILLTRWKQATATKALESEAFRDLDVSEISRNVWFTMIVRKFTNYFHQVYKKSHSESLPPIAVKGNPLLKFTSVLSGRQMFARDMHGSIIDVSRQRASDTGENEAAAYQHVLKGMWDALSSDEKSEWDAKAEDECGDIEINQKEFGSNIHLALRGLCQGGLIGDAEMLLFYAFRDEASGDLLAGTVHGHSKHNKANFGGDDLQQKYGVPWSNFAESVIPRPVASRSAAITVNEDGSVIFPVIDLETLCAADCRLLLQEYFEQCWIHRESDLADEVVPIPWADIGLNPSKFYDTQKFVFHVALKDPATLDTVETMMIVKGLNSADTSLPFHFRHGISLLSVTQSSAPLSAPSLSSTPAPSIVHTPARSISPAPIRTPTPARSISLPPIRTPTPSPPPPSQPKAKNHQSKRSRDSAEDVNSRQPKKRRGPGGTSKQPARRSSRSSAPKTSTQVASVAKAADGRKASKKPKHKGWVMLSGSEAEDDS